MPPPLLKLPVVFRPHSSESLSSWIARIAGVYRVDAATLFADSIDIHLNLTEIDLQPSPLVLEQVSRLTRLHVQHLQHHTIYGSHPYWLPDWITLRPPHWHTNSGISIVREGALFSYCQACLSGDLNARGQFFRLDWLCAATTICSKHLVLLDGCKEMGSLPYECQHTRAGSRFFCRDTGDPLDLRTPCIGDRSSITLLSSFEQTIQQALFAAPPHAVPGTAQWATGHELLAIVEDLTWVLMLPVAPDGTRLLHCLQTNAFPVPRGLRLPFEVYAPSRADLILRRAIFSVIACLLRPREFARFTRASHDLGSTTVNAKLLDLLGSEQAGLFLSRAHRWPPCFRRNMRKAGRTAPLV